ncbi:MAG: O-methyltransferase, partial [Mycobacteriales bacterium]
TGDAGEYLAGLPDGAVDVLFLDAERTEYLGWWPHPLRVLRPGGLLAMDNVLSHADEVADVRALLEADPTVASTVVDIGKGELLAVTALGG